jgi:hypothetical protein
MTSIIRPILSISTPKSLFFLLFLVASTCFYAHPAFADGPAPGTHRLATNYQTIIPQISNEVLLNPGKGWVLYGTPRNQSAETIAYATTGYMRYNWSDIEPAEGKYNWSFIDNDLNAWHAVGRQFAFGVMNANSSNPSVSYVTPKWVFDDGADVVRSHTMDKILGLSGFQFIPVWDDPIFFQKVQDFVTALAHRYDGNPNIAFIDIRSYGNWGVQKLDGLPQSKVISSAMLLKHVQIYRNAFKRTQLMLPWGITNYQDVYDWAGQNGLGLRRDGIMVDSDGSELASAFGNEPIVYEFYSTYQWLVNRGYWKDSKLMTAVRNGKPSYINLGQWGNDGQVMLSQKLSLIQTLANLMGYHFVLTSATIPDTISNNQASTFSLSWKNDGISYVVDPADVAIALLDSSDNVVQKQWFPRVDGQDWVPGKTTLTNASLTFSNVPIGTYKLAVGVFQHTADANPTYRIGNQGRTSNDWYVLSTVSVI